MGDMIKNIMAQVFQIDAASIDASTSPESVERWDSLKHMQLIMALEDEFAIQFPDDTIPELLSYADIVSQVDVASYTSIHQNQLYTHLGDNRGANGGPDHDPARDNILAHFQGLGLDAGLDPFVHGGYAGENVVGVKTSAVNPNDVYLVGAHYDSVNNPGADDNCSGVAGVLESARILAQIPTRRSIRSWETS